MRESSVERRDFQQARKAPEQRGGTTSLENDLVGKDEHAGLGEKIGIHMFRLNDGQDFAVDEVQHVLPDFRGHGLKSEWSCRPRYVGS